ncbi:MAG: carbonic anhydrase family protein [Terricaulis sp.]
MRIGSAGPVLAVILAACGAQAASTPHGEAGDAHAATAAHGAPAHGDAHAHPAVAHGANATPAAHNDGAHWSYNDQAAWAHNADACGAGVEQSPINLSSAAPVAEVPDLNPRYLPLEGAFVNNGHTLQFAPAANTSVLTIGADAYNLVQFHFHSPAEHTLDRRAYPVELHFVHRNSAGQLAVVGVFIEEGAENPALAALIAAKPQAQGDANATHIALDPTALLPGDRTYFAYAGSLTTPPCSQGVRWNVLRTPIQASPAQVAALREALGASSRHVQAHNQRTVLLGL